MKRLAEILKVPKEELGEAIISLNNNLKERGIVLVEKNDEIMLGTNPELSELIENLLDASRLQAGALKLNLSDVALDKLAAQLADKFRTQTDRHTFMVEFPPDFPPVRGDEERLRQVISNLLSNAIKYSPGGGAIQVKGRVEPERVIVAVNDEGMGLPTEELEKVFDRFYRADTAATKRAQGAGLGLFLAKAVVEAHGGQIWAASESGRGATFSFSLPRE